MAQSTDFGVRKQPLTLDWTDAQYHDRGIVTLLVQALKRAIHELAKAKGVENARVLEKVNARGEMVIALIIPPSKPGEWGGK